MTMARIQPENYKNIADAIDSALFFMTASEWQDKIINVISEMSATSEEEISSNCVYNLTMLYNMFGQLKEAGF